MDDFVRFGLPRGLDFKVATIVDRLATDNMNLLDKGGYRAYRGDRLAAAILHFHPEPQPACLSFVNLVSQGCGTQAAEKVADGDLMFVAVSSYARPSELLRLKLFLLVRPQPGITESWALLLSPEERPERSKTAGVRRVHPPRFSLALPLAAAPATAKRSTYQRRHSWPFHRQSPPIPHTSGSAEARRLEEPSQCAPLREKCPTGSHIRPAAGRSEAARSTVRAKPFGNHVGHNGATRLQYRQLFPGRYVMYLGGGGGVARACEQLGFKAWVSRVIEDAAAGLSGRACCSQARDKTESLARKDLIPEEFREDPQEVAPTRRKVNKLEDNVQSLSKKPDIQMSDLLLKVLNNMKKK
eukprot:s985_g20.t1